MSECVCCTRYTVFGRTAATGNAAKMQAAMPQYLNPAVGFPLIAFLIIAASLLSSQDSLSDAVLLREHAVMSVSSDPLGRAYFASGTPWVFLSVRTRTVFGRDATTAPSVTVAPPSPSIFSLGSRVANATLTGFFAP